MTWTTPDGEDFKVELVLIDDPVSMRDAYAAGQVHIGWATLDMVPLFMDELKKDSRLVPRIFQQVDWSNGGDGIVIRSSDGERSGQTRRWPTCAARRSSWRRIRRANTSFSMLSSMAACSLPRSSFVYTQDAFQAAAAFNADKSIAACVTWAPDIYNLSDVDSATTCWSARRPPTS